MAVPPYHFSGGNEQEDAFIQVCDRRITWKIFFKSGLLLQLMVCREK